MLELMRALPAAPVATVDEAPSLIRRRALMDRGIGWVDVQLLGSGLLASVPI